MTREDFRMALQQAHHDDPHRDDQDGWPGADELEEDQ